MKNVELLVHFRPLEERSAALGWLHGLFQAPQLLLHLTLTLQLMVGTSKPAALGETHHHDRTVAEGSSTQVMRAPL